MSINIYKDQLLEAELLGRPVLYTTQTIPREEVPEGWHCYDLCGTDRRPSEPVKLMDQAPWDHAGTVLSPKPLKRESTLARQIKGQFFLSSRLLTLSEFCQEQGLSQAQDPRKYIPRPASPDEAGLFHAQANERDKGPAGVSTSPKNSSTAVRFVKDQRYPGYIFRIYDKTGKGLLGLVGTFSDLMRAGLVKKVTQYSFDTWKCIPSAGRIECWSGIGATCEKAVHDTVFGHRMDRSVEGPTKQERRAFRDASDPDKPHSYSWYVIENINDPVRRISHELPLEEAIQLYNSLDCEDKRLGITKDSIISVDLVGLWEGCEWLPEDRLKMDSFKDDPVVAEAVVQLQQRLEAKPLVGRVTFASGERWNFTDPQKYLQTVQEELPYQATTGFRCETLTDDPAIRKAVDDMICDLYGEDDPKRSEDHSMTMGGM